MTARTLGVLGLLALMAGGCALPSWVPFVGKKSDRPAPPATVAAPPAASRGTTSGAPEPRRAPDDDSVTDRVVAVVNNDAITLGELQEAIAVYRHENRLTTEPVGDDLVKQFLGRLIDSRLQLQEAEREKITVDDAEVDEDLASKMKRFNTTTREEFEALLRTQGLTMEAFRKRVRDSLRVARLIRRKVTLRVSVTEAEIAKYLAENRQKLETGLGYRARHLLVVPDVDTDAGWEAARIRADLLRAQVLEGADFTELARQHSRDASARDGGDLGPLKRGELAQDVESQILRLDPGQVSAPYRSPLGYHLFRLESKESLEGEGIERAREQIRDILFRQKYEARLEAWLTEIKQRAIIDIRL